MDNACCPRHVRNMLGVVVLKEERERFAELETEVAVGHSAPRVREEQEYHPSRQRTNASQTFMQSSSLHLH